MPGTRSTFGQPADTHVGKIGWPARSGGARGHSRMKAKPRSDRLSRVHPFSAYCIGDRKRMDHSCASVARVMPSHTETRGATLHQISAAAFIQASFEDHDLLAVVLVRQGRNETQRLIRTTRSVATPTFQSWLHRQNSERFTVFLSPNPLSMDSTDRTRFVYIDLANVAAPTTAELTKKSVPKPNHILEILPSRYRWIWRVQRFDIRDARNLAISLAHEFCGDPASIEHNPMIPAPGFFTHNNRKPHLVHVHNLSRKPYKPSDFPSGFLLPRDDQ